MRSPNHLSLCSQGAEVFVAENLSFHICLLVAMTIVTVTRVGVKVMVGIDEKVEGGDKGGDEVVTADDSMVAAAGGGWGG